MRRHSITLALFAALNAADIATTRAGIAAGIPEGNPIPAAIMAAHGEAAMYVVKVGLCLLAAFAVVCLPQYQRLHYALKGFSAVLAIVVLSNLSLIL